MIDGIRYRLKEDEIYGILLTGPVSTSQHLADKERIYSVEGTDLTDIVLVLLSPEKVDNHIVPLFIGEEVESSEVYTDGEGD